MRFVPRTRSNLTGAFLPLEGTMTTHSLTKLTCNKKQDVIGEDEIEI
jgi:hypothetical protein